VIYSKTRRPKDNKNNPFCVIKHLNKRCNWRSFSTYWYYTEQLYDNTALDVDISHVLKTAPIYIYLQLVTMNKVKGPYIK